MRRVNEQIIARSISEFTGTGIERLDPNKKYLYVSNHRDIMLDACLLQYYLVINGFDTTEITFGANLMMNPVVIDVGKSNKMFRVERPGGDIKEFYRASLHLSEYILNDPVTEKGRPSLQPKRPPVIFRVNRLLLPESQARLLIPRITSPPSDFKLNFYPQTTSRASKSRPLIHLTPADPITSYPASLSARTAFSKFSSFTKI